MAHIDVVPALREDWSIDPWTLLERDGFFYGRGTTDNKAGAAMLVANFIRLKREGWQPRRDVIVAPHRRRGDESGEHPVAAEGAPAAGGCGVRVQYRFRRHHPQGQTAVAVHRAGEREGLRRLPARSHRCGRPQLARAAGQPDLHAGRGAAAGGGPPVSVERDRRGAFVLRAVGARRNRPARGRHARRRGGHAGSRRRRRGCRLSPSTTLVCARPAWRHAWRPGTRTTRCRRPRVPWSTAASCPASHRAG